MKVWKILILDADEPRTITMLKSVEFLKIKKYKVGVLSVIYVVWELETIWR